MDEAFYNRVGGERIASRQIDELVGLARGLAADGVLSDAEVQCLQSWLAANGAVNDQPLVRDLYQRIDEIMRDGQVDEDERSDLLATLQGLTGQQVELGEVLKPTTLPLCTPAPTLTFPARIYCFTGTFNYGRRSACDAAVRERGGASAGLSRKTDVLVIGAYVTESWKHSTFGLKIMQALEWRDRGAAIAIVSEDHWRAHL